jgi:hypothetical protein
MERTVRIIQDAKSFFILCILIIRGLFATAQTDSSHLRVSLLTVGVGDEIYASFGHTGIRIVDSVAGTDIVYNWGTFDGYQDNFELKFTQGKLLYYASSEPYQHFVQTYVYEKRGVEEQELYLNDAQKRSLQAIILDNLAPENRYYKYDFLFDNCATRPRDILKKALGPTFQWGKALPPQFDRHTFRDETDRYLAHLPWERFGINLLLGSPVDKVMSNEDAMFLPDNLRNGMAGASVGTKPVAAPAQRILPPAPPEPEPSKAPFFVMLAFSAFVIIGSTIPGIKPLAIWAGNLLLIVTGLLGCLMLFMWLGTDHQSCRNNFNVLWCLPTNIIIPFVKREKRSRYALVAMALIVVAVVLHVLKIQALPMGVIWPLLLALMAFFGMIYRSAKAPESDESNAHHHH